MFVRLGTHKNSIYGVMDLTSGYHQAPLSLAARVFMAFITFCGIFQYLRLPFGPKRAPPYFQEMMAAVVLVGLCYFICEIYLDDCIVHGATDKSFLENLEKVFQRFSKHKLFLKPGKCKFGVPKVEFCGQVISKEGIMNATFTDRTKLSSSKLLFGNAVNLDRGIFAPAAEISRTDQPLSDVCRNYWLYKITSFL
jgi:hypothetical protein